MELKIVQVGDPVLRRRARALEPDEIRSAEIARLIELMRETMRGAPGVGLAAPQIGASIQLVVIEDRPEYQATRTAEELAATERRPVPFQVLINPTLTVLEPSPLEHFEGCLSVPDLHMVVPRARGVQVQALDHRGQAVTLVESGWPARILQHEVDHLNGVLCVDRMRPRTLATARTFARHWHGRAIPEVLAELGE